MKGLLIAGGVVLVLFLVGIGLYNAPVGPKQRVDEAWGNVETAQQRKFDLIPNVVATVKGAANFEQSTIEAVTAARASVGSIKLTADDLGDPAKMKAFMEAEKVLSASLGRLIATAEAYPDLKATQAYRDLITELEGSDNRIATERHKYNAAVREYNTVLETFPSSVGASMHGYKTREPFAAEPAALQPVKVEFGSK